MNKLRKNPIFWVAVGATCVFAGILLIKIVLNKNGDASHPLTSLRVESTVKQTVDGLANELKGTDFVNELQDWSIETLARYNSGAKIGDTGAAPNLPLRGVVISRENIAPFVLSKWKDAPEVVILVGTNRTGESILIDWYSYGVVVGSKSCRLEDLPWQPYYSNIIQPGVFAVWVDSK